MQQYNFKPQITKEILENGSVIWKNNISNATCVFTANHTIFFDGKDTFFVYGEKPIWVTSGDFIEPKKIKEFFKGNSSHGLYVLDDVVFIDKVGVQISDYEIIFKTELPKAIRTTTEERKKNWLKDNQLSILFTKTKDELSKLIGNHFHSYILQTTANESKPLEFIIFLN